MIVAVASPVLPHPESALLDTQHSDDALLVLLTGCRDILILPPSPRYHNHDM